MLPRLPECLSFDQIDSFNVNILLLKETETMKLTFMVPMGVDPIENVVKEMRNCLRENEVEKNEIRIYLANDPQINIDYIVQLEYNQTVHYDPDLFTESDFNTTDNILMSKLNKFINDDHLVKKFSIGDLNEGASRESSVISVDYNSSSSPSSNKSSANSENKLSDHEEVIPEPEEVMVVPPDLTANSIEPLANKSDSVEVLDNSGTICLSESPVLSGQRSKKRSTYRSIVTIYPPPPAHLGIAIRVNDYTCLSDGQYLNDVIIDFFIRYLCLEELSMEDRQRVHVFSTQFYSRLVERGLENIHKWTKDVNIFEKKFLIVPINENFHWYLAIVCFIKFQLNEDDCTMTRAPCILIMDSLSGRPKPEVVKNIKIYLEHELQVKIQKSNDFSFLSVFYPSVPRQPNFTDCGLYLLQFVECFLKEFLHAPCPVNLNSWFEHSVILSKREEIANLIRSLASDCGMASISDLPELIFAAESSSSGSPEPKKPKMSEEEILAYQPYSQRLSEFAEKFSSSLELEERKISSLKIKDSSEDRKWSAFVSGSQLDHSRGKSFELPKFSSSSKDMRRSSSIHVNKSTNDRTYHGKSTATLPHQSFETSDASSSGAYSPYSETAYMKDWSIPSQVSYRTFKKIKNMAGSDLERRSVLKSFKNILSQVTSDL